MKTILHALHVHATPDAVFDALATDEGLAGWWSTRVEAEPRVGGHVDFTFFGDFNPRMKITELDPPRRLGWKCVAGHDNWLENTFSFSLDERAGETLLTFRQEYARELSDEVYGNYNFNWGWYLASLKRLCETGQGNPFSPPDGASGADDR